MITVICTTNRSDSNSRKAAELYTNKLAEMGENVQLLDMKDVNADWVVKSNYGDNYPEFESVVSTYIRSAEKIILIVPEYNGGFPGYFKFFLDACDQHEFKDKKIAMMGLAAGRSGNIRGLDHLTGIFHYLGSEVYSKKVYLSMVNHSLSASGDLKNEVLENEIAAQLKGFVSF